MNKRMHSYRTKVKKPRIVLYYTLLFFVRIFVKAKCRFKVIGSAPKIKDPFIIIFNHPSKLDFAYSYIPMWRRRISTMVAYFYFCDTRLGNLLHRLGCYPKYLFSPDISAIKNTMKIIKAKGAVGIAPEGRLSPHGALESFHLSTAKLIKKLEVDVISNHINGAYLTFPKWAKDMRKGRVEVEYKHLIKKEDIKNMSEEDINNILAEALQYDDFAWQEQRQIKYKSKKMAEGLEYILIRCPRCNKLYTIETSKDKLWCNDCGLEAKLDNTYKFHSKEFNLPNIRDWYLYQKSYEKNNLSDDFILSSNVILKFPDPKGRGFAEVGRGETKLSKTNLVYEGSINGEHTKLSFPLQKIEVILFGANEDFEVYHENNFYYFVPENIKECARYSLVAEEFNRRLVNERTADV